MSDERKWTDEQLQAYAQEVSRYLKFLELSGVQAGVASHAALLHTWREHERLRPGMDKDEILRNVVTTHLGIMAQERDGPDGKVSVGAVEVVLERMRQRRVEGFGEEHDDNWIHGELIGAAECYLWLAHRQVQGVGAVATEPSSWPWDGVWWKPSGVRENLVKAGALIAAEIDRLDRAEGRS